MSSLEAPTLPEGWTRHELNGRVFYFNASTNTTQSELPVARPASSAAPLVHMAVPAPQEPQSEPQPSAPPMPEALRTHHVVSSTPQPAALATATPSAAAPTAAPVAPAAALAAVWAQPRAPSPPSAEWTPTQQLLAASPIVSVAQVKVLVPTGVAPGQQVAFTAPGHARQMFVTVPQGAPPGSIVTVQYTTTPEEGPALPQNTVQLEELDRQAMIRGWGLYACGWCCWAACLSPLGLLCWGMAALLYYCKPRPTRAERTRERTPALLSLLTCGICLFLLCIVWAIVLANDDFDTDRSMPHPHSVLDSAGGFLHGPHKKEWHWHFFHHKSHHMHHFT